MPTAILMYSGKFLMNIFKKQWVIYRKYLQKSRR